MIEITKDVEISEIEKLEVDYDSVDWDPYRDNVVKAKAYVIVTFKYRPTEESWKEKYSVELYGDVHGAYYIPATMYNSWGDPGDPAEGGWDYVEFNELGDVEFEDTLGNLPEAIDDTLYTDEFVNKIVEEIEKNVENQLPFDDCENWG